MLLLAEGALNADRFDRVLRPKRGGLEIDLSATTFVDPYGLVGICCLCAGARRSRVPVRVVPPVRRDVANYLARMGLAEALEELGLSITLAPVRARALPTVLLPLQHFDNERVLDELSQLLHSAVGSEPATDLVLEALWELGVNAVEHSHAVGFVAAQTYRRGCRGSRIELVVGDGGIGLRQSLQGRHFVLDDLEAIRMAQGYLVTSLADEGRGQGLAVTREETLTHGGEFMVRSGSGLERSSSGGLRRRETVPKISGTIIRVSLPCM